MKRKLAWCEGGGKEVVYNGPRWPSHVRCLACKQRFKPCHFLFSKFRGGFHCNLCKSRVTVPKHKA